ncbi:hypothetical protein S83_005063 [Arachis hypogaea]
MVISSRSIHSHILIEFDNVSSIFPFIYWLPFFNVSSNSRFFVESSVFFSLLTPTLTHSRLAIFIVFFILLVSFCFSSLHFSHSSLVLLLLALIACYPSLVVVNSGKVCSASFLYCDFLHFHV